MLYLAASDDTLVVHSSVKVGKNYRKKQDIQWQWQKRNNVCLTNKKRRKPSTICLLVDLRPIHRHFRLLPTHQHIIISDSQCSRWQGELSQLIQTQRHRLQIPLLTHSLTDSHERCNWHHQVKCHMTCKQANMHRTAHAGYDAHNVINTSSDSTSTQQQLIWVWEITFTFSHARKQSKKMLKQKNFEISKSRKSTQNWPVLRLCQPGQGSTTHESTSSNICSPNDRLANSFPTRSEHMQMQTHTNSVTCNILTADATHRCMKPQSQSKVKLRSSRTMWHTTCTATDEHTVVSHSNFEIILYSQRTRYSWDAKNQVMKLNK